MTITHYIAVYDLFQWLPSPGYFFARSSKNHSPAFTFTSLENNQKIIPVISKAQNYSNLGLGNQLLPLLAILFSPHQDTQKVLSTIYHIAALPTLLQICRFDIKLTEGNGRSLTEFNWFYIMTKDQMYSLHYKEKFNDSWHIHLY